jgi:hypothetical protein
MFNHHPAAGAWVEPELEWDEFDMPSPVEPSPTLVEVAEGMREALREAGAVEVTELDLLARFGCDHRHKCDCEEVL